MKLAEHHDVVLSRLSFSAILLRQVGSFIICLHFAVWVYCGDQDKCGGQYMDCWLKHLVSSIKHLY